MDATFEILDLNTFIIEFIHSCNICLLSTYYVPVPVLGAGSATINNPPLRNLVMYDVGMGKLDSEHNKCVSYIIF